MQSANKELIVCVLVIIVLMFTARCCAEKYEYKGVYPAQAIFTNLCENCYLELPVDFMKTELNLSVNTDKESVLHKALISSARSQGWTLSKQGNVWRAEPVQNEGNVVYISCLDNQPKNVPKYLYQASVASDKILCAKRDSVESVERQKADYEKAILDSLKSVPPLEFGNYELRYYSFTKNFADKMGMEWSGIIAEGNLHNRFKIYDDWKLHASETNDTTFNYRQINVAFDSSLSIDWGTEEQTLKTTYVTSNGIVNTDYEWRKYGLIVSLQKDTSRIKMGYVFRDKEQNISVLQGSAVGTIGDTLVITGQYTTQRTVTVGIPFLSRVPLLKYLVSTEQVLTDIKEFELYLLPTEKAVVNEHGRFEKSGQDTTSVKK